MSSCPNSILDQALSLASASAIDLWKLDPVEIELAIARIERAPRGRSMPPPEARQLDEHTRERLLEYQRADPFSLEPHKHLQRPAVVGMVGGAKTSVHFTAERSLLGALLGPTPRAGDAEIAMMPTRPRSNLP